MPYAKPIRWHPVVLPDDYIRKMKQDLAEADAMVESKTRRARPETENRGRAD